MANIKDYRYIPGFFVIHIPVDCYVTSFYKSDDPNEWKKANDHKVTLRKINRVRENLMETRGRGGN